MRKREKLLLVGALTVLASAPVMTLSTDVLSQVAAQQQLQNQKVSLGASLTDQQVQETLKLLNIDKVASNDLIKIDGAKINQYLNLGTPNDVGVYSSAIIEPREPGYGVQVQIVTPQTINQVTAQTYQNAAITSGAKDVLIKIGSLKPVTGEGALAGVYAIYEANGNKLNIQNIKVAQKEVTLPTEIKEKSQLTDAQINELTANIKAIIAQRVKEKKEISDDEILQIINEQSDAITKKYNVEISDSVKKVIFNVMKEFAKIQIDSETIDDSNQESWTAEQAIDIYEAAMHNGQNVALTDFPNNYDRSLWKEVSRKGNRTIMQYEDRFYSFDKQVDYSITQITVAYSQEELDNNFLTRYDVDFNTRLIIHQVDERLLDNQPDGKIIALEEGQTLDYLVKALFPTDNNVKAVYGEYDSPSDAYYYRLVTLDSQGQEQILGDYRVHLDGTIDHVDHLILSDYPIKRPDQLLADPLFNADKDQVLQNFMAEWGKGMNQIYQRFTPEAPGEMYGPSFPNEIIDLLAVDNQAVNAKWSTDGFSSEKGEYAIVAAYNDTADFRAKHPDEPAGDHYYLFAIVNGEPVVLHSQQNQGAEDGRVHFSPTENAALQAGFKQIVEEGTYNQDLIPVAPEPEETTTEPEETTTEPEETTAEPEETTTEEETMDPVYNPDKDQALKTFMDKWGTGMDQVYERFTPDEPGEMYGPKFPNEILPLLAVNDQAVEAVWSEDGISQTPGQYAVVAAYNDTKDFRAKHPDEPAGDHYYLFAIVDGQPVVLHSQQNEGQPSGLVHFVPTENTALQAAFEQIIANGYFDESLVPDAPAEAVVDSPEKAQSVIMDLQLDDETIDYDQPVYRESLGAYEFVGSQGSYYVYQDGHVEDEFGNTLN